MRLVKKCKQGSDVEQTYGKFLASGRFVEKHQANMYKGGGLVGLLPAIPTITVDLDKVTQNVNNLYQYSKSYLEHKLEGDGDGEVIDLSDKKVARIKSNTPNVTSILTNDFIESNNNTIRRKKDFVNTTDTLLGDKKIPLSKIATFYGVEDGKLKAGPLNVFGDETTVVPNRAKYVGKIKEYFPGNPWSEEYKNIVAKAIELYNKEHGYKPTGLARMLPFLYEPIDILTTNLLNEEGRDYKGIKRAYQRRHEIIKDIYNKHSDLGAGFLPYLVTENNDTIRDVYLNTTLNATPKVLFADENGNAMFVANPKAHAKEMNTILQKTPMYPIMVDNGRYATYQTTFPNAEIYGGFNRPDNMFLIGTQQSDKPNNIQ